jgi:hypothetical protein
MLNAAQRETITQGYPSATIVSAERKTGEYENEAAQIGGGYAATVTLSTGWIVVVGRYGVVLSEERYAVEEPTHVDVTAIADVFAYTYQCAGMDAGTLSEVARRIMATLPPSYRAGFAEVASMSGLDVETETLAPGEHVECEGGYVARTYGADPSYYAETVDPETGAPGKLSDRFATTGEARAWLASVTS